MSTFAYVFLFYFSFSFISLFSWFYYIFPPFFSLFSCFIPKWHLPISILPDRHLPEVGQGLLRKVWPEKIWSRVVTEGLDRRDMARVCYKKSGQKRYSQGLLHNVWPGFATAGLATRNMARACCRGCSQSLLQGMWPEFAAEGLTRRDMAIARCGRSSRNRYGQSLLQRIWSEEK
jgi:hypothetical protein